MPVPKKDEGNRERGRQRNCGTCLSPKIKFEKLVNYFDTGQKAIEIIAKELKDGCTRKVEAQIFVLGKALVDALVAFLEILQRPVPGDLLIALRKPGLLIPVNESPPNDLGICGLVGNVWEWTSTTNEKGDHLICGGAWTKEKYDPDKKEWRPPGWRDINLGFRCVCDWDKIGDVKEPTDLLEKPPDQVEVKTEDEEDE